MSLIKLTIYSTEENYSNVLGKEIIKKLIGPRQVCNGVIRKFSNALGFADLTGKPIIGTHDYVDIKYTSPKNYLTPLNLLLESMMFFNQQKEIVSFVVENKRMYHNLRKYSYDTLEMLVKFQSFIYKIYGDKVSLEISISNSLKISVRDKLLSHFYLCYAESKYVDNEIMLNRFVNKKETKYIVDFFNSLGEKVYLHTNFDIDVVHKDQLRNEPDTINYTELRYLD